MRKVGALKLNPQVHFRRHGGGFLSAFGVSEFSCAA